MVRILARISPNLILLLGSLLISLLLFEVLIRAFYPLPPGHQQIFVTYDPLLGWKKKSNIVGEHVTSEYSVLERINSKGIRGREYAYGKEDGEYRILILGDSFAEGYSVEFEELFSEVLKAKLNLSSADDAYFEVINTGTAGYSTDQELLFFLNEGKHYDPDLTILMFFDNDIWYNNQSYYWRGHKPMFRLTDNKTLVLTNVPVPEPNNEPPKRKFVNGNSFLLTFVRDRMKNIPFIRTIGTQLGLTRAELPIPGDFKIYEVQPNNDVAEAWEITEALIVKLKEETALSDSELLIFFVPARENVYPEVWNVMKEHYGISDDEWDMKQVQKRLEDICKRNGIECITPIDTFRTKSSELQTNNQLMYFAKDKHWNANGHKFAGELLADYIYHTFMIDRRIEKPD